MLTATCHCGATRMTLPRLPASATLCNCSFCSKKGALWGYFDPAEVGIAEEAGAVYAPSGMNKHGFCARCGCATHALTPNWRAQAMEGAPFREDASLSVNLRLLDGVDVEAIPVERVDGRGGW